MEPFIGQIQAFGFNYPPNGWAFCDGQIMAIAQNTALFSLLGTVYGGNGQTTFALPDLRGRTMVHPGQGPGLNLVSQGEMAGVENLTMLLSNLPPHNHGVSVSVKNAIGEEPAPTGKIAGRTNGFSEDITSGKVLGGVSETAQGGNVPMAIRNPFLGVYCSISLFGVFPSRN